MRCFVAVLALVAVGWAQETPAPAPTSTKSVKDGKLTESYWSFTYEAPELAEDELGLGGGNVLFEGTMAGGMRVQITVIELGGPGDGNAVREWRKKSWAAAGTKLEEAVEGADPVPHMLFVQESLAGFKRHKGYAWYMRGTNCYEVHIEAPEKTEASGAAIKKALAGLKLGGDKGANLAQFIMAQRAGKPINDPQVILQAAMYYATGSREPRRMPNYPVAAGLFGKARELAESDKSPYDAIRTFVIYAQGGLSVLSPPLRDAPRAAEWLVKAEAAAKELPEADRGTRGAIASYNLACAYGIMEKLDEAFAALDRSFSYAPGTPPVDRNHLEKDQDLDSLRGDARWKAFLAKFFPGEKPADAPKKPDGG